MRKLGFIMREVAILIREHKLYFLAPLVILLSALAVLFFHFGPSTFLVFIYAGI